MDRLITPRRSRWTRDLTFYVADAILVALSVISSFIIRFDGQVPSGQVRNLFAFLSFALVLKMLVFSWQRLYRISWAHVSFAELAAVVRAVTLASILLGILVFILRGGGILAGFPRGVLFIDYLLTLVLIGGLRSAKRIYAHFSRLGSQRTGRRTLIVGAGDAGQQVLMVIHRTSQHRFVVGFVDDDPDKQGVSFYGVPVLGTRRDIPRLVRDLGVQEVLIAMPSAPSDVIRDAIELARRAGITHIKVVPHLHELISGEVRLPDIRDIRLEDLLGRQPVRIDEKELFGYLRGKTAMVTGAGGSIGSELCKQITKFSPKTLIMVDQDETALFEIHLYLSDRISGIELLPIVGDICNRPKMHRIFSKGRPQIIFHAAAYKHVPVMEEHPDEAVRNNIIGTLIVGEMAVECGAEKFVLISTDKAVNPSSVMGATKRAAEMVIQELNRRGRTRFMGVRFGNVLGSRGSIIPLIQDQIRRGGPVTVTDPEMYRYLMSASEATLLVLQAGAMGDGGEIFILDMGEPMRILDLVTEYIRLNGLEPDKDIPIVFTGPRPGEKLFEDLVTAEEGSSATRHEKILIARIHADLPGEALFAYVAQLERLSDLSENQQMIELLRKVVPTYHPTY